MHLGLLVGRQLALQRPHVRGRHRQEQIGLLNLIGLDAVREMTGRQLVATRLQHAHGTAVDRVAVLLIADAAGHHAHAVAQPPALEFGAQDDLGHRGTADVAGAHGHHGIRVNAHIGTILRTNQRVLR